MRTLLGFAALFALCLCAPPPAARAASAPSPRPAAATPDTAGFRAEPGAVDSLLDALAGVWEGHFDSGGSGIDRLIGTWKYNHNVLQLQSRVFSGPRKDYEIITFIRRLPGEARYAMLYVDASGALLSLEGHAEGRVLEFEGAAAAGRVRLRYDLGRPHHLTLARDDAPEGGEARTSWQVTYALGRLKRN